MQTFRNTTSYDVPEILHAGYYEIEGNTLISDKERQVIEIVNFVILCGIVGLFGIIGNFVNIIIFYKQGFKNTVNIAFLGLAISDLCVLITLEWITTSMNPLLVKSGVPWVFPEVMYLSGAWLHVGFCRVTSYVTVYITAERYICIAFPLRVKEMVTPKTTTVIVSLIYFINIVILIPEYATSYLGWKFVPEKNKTLIGIIFTTSRTNVEGVCYVIHSMLSTTAFVGVIVFTLVLVIKLRQSSEWRRDATPSHSKRDSMSTRDQKMVKMVVLIASILIICYIPGATIALATFIVGTEKFSLLGGYFNVCVAVWAIACSFQTLNSSINIVLYYRMSSKYRQTFHDSILKRFKHQ